MQQAEKIIAYLKGELSGDERRLLEERLSADADLQAALRDYRTILEGFKGMRYEALREEVAAWDPDDQGRQLMAYAARTLDPEAAAGIERAMEQDPELKQQVAHYRTLIEGFKAMQMDDFSREVEGWSKSLPSEPSQREAVVVPVRQRTWRGRRYAVAAVLLALVAAAIWLFGPFDLPEATYTAFRENNYVAPALDGLERGAEAALGDATRAYAREEYAEAAAALEAIPPADSLFSASRYLLGHAYYRQGRYRAAVEAFTQSLEAPGAVDDAPRNFNRDNAAWTRILAQLALFEDVPETSGKRELRELLAKFLETANPSDTYYAKAIALEQALQQ